MCSNIRLRSCLYFFNASVAATDRTAPDSRRMGRTAGDAQRPVSPGGSAERFSPGAADAPPPATDVRIDERSFHDTGTDPKEYPTGWEKERAALFAPAYQPASSQLGVAGGSGDLGGISCAVVQLGHHLEGTGDVASAYTARPHTDRKARRKELELKIAHGHAEDDHEEYQGPNLSM